MPNGQVWEIRKKNTQPMSYIVRNVNCAIKKEHILGKQ